MTHKNIIVNKYFPRIFFSDANLKKVLKFNIPIVYFFIAMIYYVIFTILFYCVFY